MCGSEVRHRAVLKAIERDADAAAAAAAAVNGSLQPVYDHATSQSTPTPTDFIYNSPTAVNHIYNSRTQLHADVRSREINAL